MPIIPDYYAKNIYEIDFNKIVNLKKKYIFVDLDNTLVGPFNDSFNDKVVNLLSTIKAKQMTMIVLSNNKKERVENFIDNLDVLYLYKAKKPNTKKMLSYIKDNNINKDECLIIGDQIMTDILLANRLNITSILLEPLEKKEASITFFPRLLDKILRKKLIKNKQLREL
ncbi:MAG: HAD-IIIA family hydrolase [Erysipelotrichaceae bacterium]|nr:HAD-IIIA family hydrolase [Erysipelotrichaceae bacterium]